MVTCSKCGVDSDVSEFYKGHRICKTCYSIANIAYYKNNSERVNIRSKKYAETMKSRGEIILPDDYMKTCHGCGKTKHKSEYHRAGVSLDGLFRLCKECKRVVAKRSDDKYYKVYNAYATGCVDPCTAVGIGIITEYVVQMVLKCESFNKIQFHSDFDLVSEIYGNIDVKSSKMYKESGWNFTKKKSSGIPDNYVCMGFDIDKVKFDHVWIIPYKADIVSKYSVYISKSNISRASRYEVDPTPYNEIYQNLDIHTLPEFRNLKCDVGGKQ